jgi:hypothetical protein
VHQRVDLHVAEAEHNGSLVTDNTGALELVEAPPPSRGAQSRARYDICHYILEKRHALTRWVATPYGDPGA